ncbi:MAG: metallophosphoesterase [Candidatus Woesebacteria bacterium]|jgi:putative phosphoesterase
MKIGIFSDSHDNIENLNKADAVFQENEIKQAFFCGDLVSPFVLKFIKDWPFPIKAVFGNNEGDHWGIAGRLKKYSITNIEYPARGIFWEEKFAGIKIAVFHGDSQEITKNLIDSGNYDLVLTGHTHEPHIKKIENTTWINPGSVAGVSENPDIKAGTIAIYDLKTKQGKIIEL